MPKWKEGAKEFTVKVNYHETRGYQLNVPRPVMSKLDRPSKVTFVLRKSGIEMRAYDASVAEQNSSNSNSEPRRRQVHVAPPRGSE